MCSCDIITTQQEVLIVKRLIFLTLFLAITFLSGCTSNSTSPISVIDDPNGVRIIDTKNSIKDTTYINETTCTNEALSPELFEIPFKTNEESTYISNADLVTYFETENTKASIEDYLRTAEVAALSVYAQNGAAIKETEYLDTIKTLYSASQNIQSGEETYSVENYATHLYELYTDNRINIEGQFITDKSLIWYNNHMYYVRGELVLNLKEDINSAFYKEFGLPLTSQNKEIHLIVQVRFIPGNPEQIMGVDILSAL